MSTSPPCPTGCVEDLAAIAAVPNYLSLHISFAEEEQYLVRPRPVFRGAVAGESTQ